MRHCKRATKTKSERWFMYGIIVITCAGHEIPLTSHVRNRTFGGVILESKNTSWAVFNPLQAKFLPQKWSFQALNKLLQSSVDYSQCIGQAWVKVGGVSILIGCASQWHL